MSISIFDWFPSFFRTTGPTLIDGGDLQQLLKLLASSATGLTARAGGGQANALPLQATYNEIDTVATGNDSVMLPVAIPGLSIYINNAAAANSLQVFGQVQNPQNGNAGDTIAPHNSSTQAATGTGVAQAAGAAALYVCTTLGQWKQLLSS